MKFRFKNLGKEAFRCPICRYKGPFEDVHPPTGHRKHARCPKCHALERHRIQYVVMRKLLNDLDVSKKKILHFAPEPFFREIFSQWFGEYETADLNMGDVDYNVDIQNLPFDDGTYDFIFASHVLEHIPDDDKALAEIRRVLTPGGIAVLPVPLVAEQTIEYPEPNPKEANHVRAPGLNYFDKFEQHFSRVEKFSSDLLPSKYQLFLYENRSVWPTKDCPLRLPMNGEKHIDIVPVCYA